MDNEDKDEITPEELYKLANYVMDKANYTRGREDLMQELVYVGLKCIDRYDKSKDVKITTYITTAMFNKMINYNRDIRSALNRSNGYVLSMEYMFENDENKFEASEGYQKDYSVNDNTKQKINYNELMSIILPMMNEFTKLFIVDGYKKSEIAKMNKVNNKAVSDAIEKNLEEIRKYLIENKIIEDI